MDGHAMWPVAAAPLNVLIALSTERAETADPAAAGVTASYNDQHPEDDEEYSLQPCFPETVAAPSQSA
eukprot:3313399-Alexandrium_andersonii.AAC.1